MDSIKPIIQLPTSKTTPKPTLKPTPEKSTLATILTSQRYRISCEDLVALNTAHGVCGNYRVFTSRGEIFAVDSVAAVNGMNECFFWDTDIHLSQLQCSIKHDATGQVVPMEDCVLRTNRMVVNKAELVGPAITVRDDLTSLTLTPRFDLTFSADSYAAQLGVVNLVQATRFITLRNSEEITVLNTGDDGTPVLYLENPQDNQAIKQVAEQQKSGETQHTFTCEISQQIPNEVAGEAVATVTVLEQYWSYFMQRALSPEDQHSIWTPAYAPISWGWSIRVGRRTDGEWGILRRKLILPTTGHDGFQLPVWTDNSVNCSVMLEI